MDLAAEDGTDHRRKLRRISTIHGRRIKTRVWFEVIEPTRIPKESTQKERKDTNIDWWISPWRFGGSLVRLYRKKD